MDLKWVDELVDLKIGECDFYNIDFSRLAGNPGSVFERDTDERSPYLKATEQTIQKAYGES